MALLLHRATAPYASSASIPNMSTSAPLATATAAATAKHSVEYTEALFGLIRQMLIPSSSQHYIKETGLVQSLLPLISLKLPMECTGIVSSALNVLEYLFQIEYVIVYLFYCIYHLLLYNDSFHAPKNSLHDMCVMHCLRAFKTTTTQQHHLHCRFHAALKCRRSSENSMEPLYSSRPCKTSSQLPFPQTLHPSPRSYPSLPPPSSTVPSAWSFQLAPWAGGPSTRKPPRSMDALP